MTTNAKVYLVGAGPGDPELLTVKALRLLQNADIVVYDRLVSREILDLVPDGVAKFYVGKSTGHHTMSQADINALLVTLAGSYRRVVRLKGGDPFIFGRGGEEARVLARHGIAFEVVPGVTAAQACAAYAGIPLTHRDLAQGVQFITGHRQADRQLQIDPATLADAGQTLVVYMGLANAGLIVADLLAAGRAAGTPAAIIERGTTPRQRSVLTSLGELERTIHEQAIQSPALLVIGEVVALARELDWYQPLGEEVELRYA